MALTNEAAEFLVKVPVRAFGTDAYSVDAVDDSAWPNIHHSFLSRGIPVYEELLNIDKLLSKQRLYFVGVPLNIKSGDGMMCAQSCLRTDCELRDPTFNESASVFFNRGRVGAILLLQIESDTGNIIYRWDFRPNPLVLPRPPYCRVRHPRTWLRRPHEDCYRDFYI